MLSGFRAVVSLMICAALYGCATVPAGGFVTETRLPAPQVIEMFRLCYTGRVTNKFGNGTDGALVADPSKGTAKVEIFAVTFRERAASDSFWGSALNHEILITPIPFGTRLEVNGSASTAAMNATHQQVGRILRGEAGC
jgi:hypothetical protein